MNFLVPSTSCKTNFISSLLLYRNVLCFHMKSHLSLMLRLFNTRCLIVSFILILNSTKFASILVINAPFSNQIQKNFITFCIVVLTGKLSGMNLHHVGFPLQRRESVLIKRYNCRYFNKIMSLTPYCT